MVIAPDSATLDTYVESKNARSIATVVMFKVAWFRCVGGGAQHDLYSGTLLNGVSSINDSMY